MAREFKIFIFPVLGVVIMLLLTLDSCDKRLKAQDSLWLQTCAHNCSGGYLMDNQRCLCLQGGQGSQGAAAAPAPEQPEPTLDQPEPTPEQAGPAPEQAGPALPKPVAPRGGE